MRSRLIRSLSGGIRSPTTTQVGQARKLAPKSRCEAFAYARRPRVGLTADERMLLERHRASWLSRTMSRGHASALTFRTVIAYSSLFRLRVSFEHCFMNLLTRPIFRIHVLREHALQTVQAQSQIVSNASALLEGHCIPSELQGVRSDRVVDTCPMSLLKHESAAQRVLLDSPAGR